MIHLLRTDARHPDFIALVKDLDAYLTEKDGDDHAFYDQYNQLDAIRYVVLAYEGDRPLGCGAIKHYAPQAMEIKRMYTTPESRGKGVAGAVLTELERWAAELGYDRCILETGKGQVEAVGLYQKCGYHVIPNYGQYVGVDYSICFEKVLPIESAA